jgi:hypothetical protein
MTGRGQNGQPPPDHDSIESDGKKSVGSPLNSIGEKRKRDSPYTSLSDEQGSLVKTASHVSIDEGAVGGRQDGKNSLEKPNSDGAEKGVVEQRQRANHISEMSKENYVQNRDSAADTKRCEDGVSKPEKKVGTKKATSRDKQETSYQWICSYCTFINPKDRDECEICELPRKTEC